MKRILIKPLITEKLTKLQENLNQYAFVVDRHATKTEIRKAIEELYPEVTVMKVRTMINPGKPKGRFTKSGYLAGSSNATKKAIISVKQGQEIDFFSEI